MSFPPVDNVFLLLKLNATAVSLFCCKSNEPMSADMQKKQVIFTDDFVGIRWPFKKSMYPPMSKLAVDRAPRSSLNTVPTIETSQDSVQKAFSLVTLFAQLNAQGYLRKSFAHN